MKRILSLYAGIFVFFILLNSPGIFAQKIQPKKLPVNEPKQITFEPDPVVYSAISRDGKWLVYSSTRENFSDLWIRSADTSVVVLPKQLTSDPAAESSPAFSPDGRFIAYVGYGYDTKGDIYLIDREKLNAAPQRLTDRDTEDGAPVFSSDGKNIYYHRAQWNTSERELAVINLKTRQSQSVDTGGDGSFPAVSPDGRYIAFVSHREDPGGDIFIFNIKTAIVSAITKGSAIDIFPAWSPDGQYVYFSRFGIDTNKDGKITPEDNSIIYRTRADENIREYSFPLTALSYSAVEPQVAGNSLYFLSSYGGVSNLWSLPSEGQIPLLSKVQDQFTLAEEISHRLPPDPALTLLGYYKVLEKFRDEISFAGKAAYKVGRLYLKVGSPDIADKVFTVVSKNYSTVQPENALSLIEQIVIRAHRKLESIYLPGERQAVISNTLTELDSLSHTYNKQPLIQARVIVEKARLLKDYGKDSESLITALSLLDQVREDFSSQKKYAAEAEVLRADIFSQTGQTEKVYQAYLSVLNQYEDVEQWADEAVERIIELSEEELVTDKIEEKIELLRKVAANNKVKYPRLSMKALNRIGDLYYAQNEWAQARAAYQQVLNQFPVATTQTASARLALAEISYQEERYSQALALYEEETKIRPYEDRIYQLARAGYIRKSLAAADSLYNLGEVAAARSIFKRLIDYDYTIIEAHRGYIKCAYTQKNLQPTLDSYLKRLEQDSEDPLNLYTAALCFTYLEDKKSLKKAEKLIREALSKQGQIEYFHQTLGYTLEVLETVYGEKGNLENAVESYHKAYFLNDHENNPSNAANLLLNIGNGYFLLGQYERAFHYYQKRAESDIPFDNAETEILFYRRFAMSAFQAGDFAQTIDTFTEALELVEKRINPHQASKVFDRVSRFTMDRILTPAKKEKDTEEKAHELAQKQSHINAQIYKHTQRDNVMPPGQGWNIYKKGIEELLLEQKKLNKEVIALSKELSSAPMKPEEVEQTLSFLSIKVEEALSSPMRLLSMKAELTDRLALAYQKAQMWEKAIENYEKAYSLNERLSLNQNLGPNRRSVAYNTYMQAGTLSGKEKEELLHKASVDFEKAIDLVNKYGVETKKKEDKTFYLIKIEQSVDKKDTTEAAYGFTADQEIRLAQAFLTRIKTESGELDAAQKEVEKQLLIYPQDKEIPENDLFGVSLLYHRAGHLAAAQRQYVQAFDRFRHSFTLSLSQGNIVSSALNVTNMASLVCRISSKEKKLPRLIQELEQSHKKLVPLLSDFPALADYPVPADYSNSMGVYALCIPPVKKSKSELERASYKMQALQKAGTHFSYGIKWLNDNILQNEESLTIMRKNLALISTLHLNMAGVASSLGEQEKAREHFEKALNLSEQGLLPHYKWRALAGLGRYDEALTALKSVTILNSRSGSQEIMNAFAPMVVEKIKANQAEQAFNLVETLSEYERINRMAPFYSSELTTENLKLFKSILTRLDRIKVLTQKIQSAPIQEEADYLTENLNREQELLTMKTGDVKDKMPTFTSLMSSQEEQHRFMLIIGLAQEIENKAGAIVKTKNKDSSVIGEYKKLLTQYNDVKEELLKNTDDKLSVTPLIIPQPVEAIDIMENLSDNGLMVRLFRVDSPEGEFLAFKVTPDSLSASFISSQEIPTLVSNSDYLVYENLLDLPPYKAGERAVTCALSGTHLYRSIVNRKPFKNRLLILPPPKKEIDNYTHITLSPRAPEKDILKILPGVHTLVIGNEIYETATVPTRAGQRPNPMLAVQKQGERAMPLNHLSGHLSNLSLALLSGTYLNDAYLVGHLFSLFGSPTLVLSGYPVGTSDFISSFLEAYSSKSALEAFNEALNKNRASQGDRIQTTGSIDSSSDRLTKRWIQLGYQGMDSDEARLFAQEYFKKYVKEAQKAFQDGNYEQALIVFENALFIAQQAPAFNQYLPNLYQLCRDSAYNSGQIDTALSYAQSYAEIVVEHSPDSEDHSKALFTVAVLHAKLEHYDKAVTIFEEVREIMAGLEMTSGEIDVLSNLGIVFENATEYDRALVQFEKAAQLGQRLEKDELVASQYINIGRIYDLRLSQYAKAKENYSKALDLYQDFGTPYEIAQAQLNIGRCERLLGNFSEADRRYSNALLLIQNEPDSERLRVKIMIEQANNAWFQGQYQEAFNLEKKSYDAARANNWALERVISLNTGGLIWWTLGDNKRALRRLDDALSLAKNLDARPDEVATTLNNIGLIYREMGQYDKALKTFNQALAIDKKLRSRWAIAYDLRNKGLTYLRMKDTDKAIPLLEKAVTETRAIGNRINESKSLLALGQAQKDRGENDRAQSTLEQALRLARSMSLRETQWRCLYELSLINLKEGDKDKARGLLTEAIEVIEGMRAEIKIEQLKNGFVINKMEVYETLVSLLIELGRIPEAFETAERSRSRNFIDLLGSQRLNLHDSIDQKLYDRERTLKSRIVEHEKLLAQAAEENERQVYKKALDSLNDEHRDLLLQIQVEHPQLASLVSVDPLGLQEIQKLLESDVALLVYYVVTDEIFSWVLKSNDIKFYRTALGRETLEEAIMEYRRLTQNLEPLEIQSNQLFNWLITDKLPDIKQIRYLGIVPHGKLHYMSFATLTDNESYLIDKFPLFYLPSANLLRYTLKRRVPDKMTSVLAIGNPSLEDPSLSLPFAEREVSSIKWNFPDITVLTQEKATETWVANNIEKFGIIHLASHGEFDPVNPLFSSIKLAKDETKDGDLDAFEVFELKINADIVVLSACQTGLGKVTEADEVIGLNRSFFYAGTHAIISSLWRVSDTSTALLSKHFYRQYVRKNKAESLRSAMLHVKNNYPHPGYWGAFTLVGDYY